jgi:hypothetical protein
VKEGSEGRADKLKGELEEAGAAVEVSRKRVGATAARSGRSAAANALSANRIRTIGAQACGTMLGRA